MGSTGGSTIQRHLANYGECHVGLVVAPVWIANDFAARRASTLSSVRRYLRAVGQLVSKGTHTMRVTGSCDSEHDTGTRSCERAGREVAARGPARVLLVLDRVALTELVKLTLNHGVYATRTVRT